MPEPLRLALVADIHHGDDKLTKRGSAALGLLDEFLAFAGEWGADMIVDLGDRISDVDRETDARLLAEVADRFAGLNTPHAHLNGNHDVAFLGEEPNSQTLGHPAGGHAVMLKGWRLIFWQADTFIPYPEPFRIRRSDLEWLEAELGKSDAPTVIFTHAPLGGGSMVGNYWFQNNPEFGGYPNAEAARAIIEAHGHVVLCISGHVHWNTLHRANAVSYLTLQSLTESFTTHGEPAAAWGALELDDAIKWRVHGRDPIEMTLPLRAPGERWARPLPGLRHQKQAQQGAADFDGVRAIVFDLDGVLYRDEEPIPGARDFVEWAIAEGLELAALTNNAGRSAEDYAAKLARLGYRIPVERIVTSAMATASWFGDRTSGARVHVVGPEALKAELSAVGCNEAGDGADFVVAGISPETSVKDLARATRILRAGAQLIMTNPDVTHPTPKGLVPEAGAILAFLEAAGGAQATVVGKPNPYMFGLALKRLGVAPEAALMIGDTPETDIRGARAAGMPSVLVETGNATEGAAAHPPTLQVADLAELKDILSARLSA